MSGTHDPGVERWWGPILDFAIHLAVGTAIFVLIAAAAVTLHTMTNWLEPSSQYQLFGLQAAEHVMFTADILLFVIFVLRAAWRAARSLVASWNT
jgi:hypothetical protein